MFEVFYDLLFFFSGGKEQCGPYHACQGATERSLFVCIKEDGFTFFCVGLELQLYNV